MSELKELLEKRTRLKRKKPDFIRKNIHKKKKLAHKWRSPRGLHNKQRLRKRGAPPRLSCGYRAPKEVRGFPKSGLAPVLVSSLKQLDSVIKGKGIILSSKLGDKKRHALLIEIKKRGLVLLNLDADKTITRIESRIKEKEEERKKKLKRREEKKKGIEEKVKKAEPKKKEEEKELPSEEKKKLEKQEKDKLLTKKT